MTFKSNFVVTLKVNGKIQREQDGIIRLPFGSDYSILLKNLESRRSVANVAVDGKPVFGGSKVIVPANDSVEISGFMNHDNVVKNKFRFIEKTEEISKYRGDKVDDGLIRVSFSFESATYPCYYYITQPNVWMADYIDSDRYWTYNNANYNMTTNCCYKGNNDAGITVNGSPTNQIFTNASVSNLESMEHVIVIKLVGKKSDGDLVVKTTPTKDKVICPTCGKKNKSYHKYCYNCSTCLI